MIRSETVLSDTNSGVGGERATGAGALETGVEATAGNETRVGVAMKFGRGRRVLVPGESWAVDGVGRAGVGWRSSACCGRLFRRS